MREADSGAADRSRAASRPPPHHPQRGEQLAGAGSIAAVIFPADAPDWQIRAAEIAENLVRKELSADERAAHTLLYAAELKASGKCVGVKEAGAAAGSRGGKIAGKGRAKIGGQPAGGNPMQKPTTTQATAAGLGISTNAVEKRVKAARRRRARAKRSTMRRRRARLGWMVFVAIFALAQPSRGSRGAQRPLELLSDPR